MRVTLRAEGTPRQSDLHELAAKRRGHHSSSSVMAVAMRVVPWWRAHTMGELGSRIVCDRWTAGGLAGLDEDLSIDQVRKDSGDRGRLDVEHRLHDPPVDLSEFAHHVDDLPVGVGPERDR